MGQERYGGRPPYLIVARTLLNVSQVLPRRKGDLWLHVSSLFFKTWERRHAVIDGACVDAAGLNFLGRFRPFPRF